MVYRSIVVHSPLVGPSTSQPLAEALRGRDWVVTAPDLRAGATSPDAFAAVVRHAVETAGPLDVVIGHSGAGAFLPALAHDIGPAATVFVDAVVPGEIGAYLPAPGLLALLDDLVGADGLLPPWHEWWPPGSLEELLPDEEQRRRVTGDEPRVPRSFHDQPVPFPPFWWRRANAYVQLSPAYDLDHQRASDWGWPTAHHDGGHLDVVARPDEVAALVVDVVGHLLDPAHGRVADR